MVGRTRFEKRFLRTFKKNRHYKCLDRENSFNHYPVMFSTSASAVARPRKLKNPKMSVTVVSTIEEDVAGSCPTAFNSIGTTAPENPAMIMDTTIEMPMTRARPEEEAQK